MSTDLSGPLAAAITTLRSPGTDSVGAVRRAAYLLPFIKNPWNLRLLLSELADSPGAWLTPARAGAHVDALAAAAVRKQRTSDPTIPFAEWTDVVLSAAAAFAPLPALAVASALLLAHAPRAPAATELLLRALAQLVENERPLDVAVACLARAQWELPEPARERLPHEVLLPAALRVVYSPKELFDPRASDIVANFGAFSHLIAICLQRVPAPALLSYLDTVDAFVRAAVARIDEGAVSAAAAEEAAVSAAAGAPVRSALGPASAGLGPSDPYFKTLLFGLTLQLKGLGLQLLHNPRLPARLIAQRVLVLFQPLGWVIDETGARFEALEFVQSLALDVLFEALAPRRGPIGVYAGRRGAALRRDMPAGAPGGVPRGLPAGATGALRVRTNRANLVIEELGERWRGLDPVLAIGRGELLYFLETSEQLLPVADRACVETVVLPAARRYLTPTKQPELTRPLFEAAHSLMLAYLDQATSPLARDQSAESAERASVEYFLRVLELYPTVLSYTQFRVALDSIFAAAAHPLLEASVIAESILEHLYDKAKATMPGVALPEPAPGAAADTVTAAGDAPPTLRAAYVAALLRALPQLTDAPRFARWLDRLGAMVPAAYAPLARAERNFIKKALADTVTALDLSLADVGIRYWFAHGAHL